MSKIMEGISPPPKLRCATCSHHSGGTVPTCDLPLPPWAEPFERPRVFGVEGDDCPHHSVRTQNNLYPELVEALDDIANGTSHSDTCSYELTPDTAVCDCHKAIAAAALAKCKAGAE
jgi:hypothetical protein